MQLFSIGIHLFKKNITLEKHSVVSAGRSLLSFPLDEPLFPMIPLIFLSVSKTSLILPQNFIFKNFNWILSLTFLYKDYKFVHVYRGLIVIYVYSTSRYPVVPYLLCHTLSWDMVYFSGKRDISGWGSKCQQTCDYVYNVYTVVHC